MKIHFGFEHIFKIINPVVTTGSFDGVHIGHLVILNRLNSIAKAKQGESVLITFSPHPRKVLFPEQSKDLYLINTQQEKMVLLEQSGIDHVIVVEFTKEFAQTTSESFIVDYLLGKLHANTIIVGFNHHFGHNRSGDYQYLFELSRKLLFDVEEIPMQDIENEAVSSTRIRKALHDGHIGRANAYLNHPYFIIGKTNRSYLLYNKAFTEILVEEEEKMLPPNGRYAAKLQDNKYGLNIICEVLNGRVLVNSVDDKLLPELDDYHLELHKTIRLFDDKDQTKTYEIDKKEVFELIY